LGSSRSRWGGSASQPRQCATDAPRMEENPAACPSVLEAGDVFPEQLSIDGEHRRPGLVNRQARDDGDGVFEDGAPIPRQVGGGRASAIKGERGDLLVRVVGCPSCVI